MIAKRCKGCLILAFCLALIYAFQGFYPDFMFLFSNLFPPVVSSATFIMSILALKRYSGSFKERFSWVWFNFSGAVGLWFLAEVIWAVYTLHLNVEIPYPSIADVLWVGGYIPLFAALFLYVRPFLETLSRRIIYFVTAIILILFALTFAIITAPAIAIEENLAATFMDFTYPILDAVLLYIAILGFAIFFKGKLESPWLFIIAGITSYTIADILFSYTTAHGLYYCGHPLELLFHWGYLLLLLAFYSHIKEL